MCSRVLRCRYVRQLGQSLQSAGRFLDAAQAYSKSLQLAGVESGGECEWEWDVTYRLAKCWKKADRFPEAIAAFRRALTLR